MTRTAKHDEQDVQKVYDLMNTGVSKVDAIRKAGFSDKSVFYSTFKRLRVKEHINLIKDEKVSFM